MSDINVRARAGTTSTRVQQGAGKATGAAGGDELDPDNDLYAPGDGLKATQKQTAGPQFGFNGARSMFSDGFSSGAKNPFTR